ncbi:MAG TPA: alpha/beta hydrolase-fold protein [Candidatus Limnocylindria bacterium]|jgi:endo-1,4-beta-xylanase|nr:alpha/beta hydrolase-fold protein [Candidatus Limnocylindria bacterium]
MTSPFVRRFLAVAAVAVLGLLPQRSVAAPDPETWKWNDPQDLKVPGMRHGTIESGSMKRTVGFNIYLPPQYALEPDRRFPVVYFLHGASGTESSDAGLAHHVHAEIVAGRLEPVIYVFPNGGQYSGYRDSTTNYVRAETLLIQELLPHIDREYRTQARSGARGICGFSMGGGGAMRLALKYPDLFGAAASLAAAIDKSPEEAGGDNVYRHAAALSREQRDRLRLYLVVGEDDFLYPRHAPFLQRLKELGIRYTYVVHSQVGHDLGKLTELSGEAMIRQLGHELRATGNGGPKR